MNFFASHPVSLFLALGSLFIWTAGNRNRSKKLVYIGIGLSVAATVTFILRI